MTIQEAIQSNKAFRRKSWRLKDNTWLICGITWHFYWMSDKEGVDTFRVALTGKDILAEDWETKKIVPKRNLS